VQRFCKEVITWKSLRHPNVLPLLGVIMAGTKFAMVSDWMANGNINQFVKAHRDANRFELVSSPLKFLTFSIIVDGSMTLVVGRCREWLDPYAQARNDPWGPQRSMYSEFEFLSLTGFVHQG